MEVSPIHTIQPSISVSSVESESKGSNNRHSIKGIKLVPEEYQIKWAELYALKLHPDAVLGKGSFTVLRAYGVLPIENI